MPKTWNISDDLDQIEYVFSVKTSTLTQISWSFIDIDVLFSVAYGEGVTEAQRGAATREGRGDGCEPRALNEKLVALKQQMISTIERTSKDRYMSSNKLTLVSPKFADDHDLVDRSSGRKVHIVAFRALALCHNVLGDKPDFLT